MTSPNRSLIGRRNRQYGEMFEKWLEDSCEFYFHREWHVSTRRQSQ